MNSDFRKKLKLEQLHRLNTEEFQHVEKSPIVVVLDDIRSILNVGSIFRTSDAYRIQTVYLCGISPTPSLEMQKTALGATDSVKWQHREDAKELIKELQESQWHVCALEQTRDSTDLREFQYPKNKQGVALIVGNEVNGVQQALIDLSNQVLELPQFGTKHSLNVSVCTGIAIWEVFRAWEEWTASNEEL